LDVEEVAGEMGMEDPEAKEMVGQPPQDIVWASFDSGFMDGGLL
jgi:RNase P/RNase MRP subunit p30